MPTFQLLSLRVGTRRTYSTHHANYLRWCRAIGLNPLQPATERQLCSLLVWYARSHKITTLSGFMSGVANYYQEHELGTLARGRQYAQTMKGLHNFFGLSESAQPKTALTWTQLTRLVDHIDSLPISFALARDKCLYLFSFYGLLRLRECVSPRLTWDHVRMHEWGMEIIVPFSKTNLRPVSVRIVSRPDSYCPTRAYQQYRSLTHPKLRASTLPFFRLEADRSSPLTTDAALSTFKHRLSTHLHLSAADYGWHSFRRGGTTALFLAGVPDSLIAIHGRWLSLTYRRYFDPSVHFTLPTAQLLTATASRPL